MVHGGTGTKQSGLLHLCFRAMPGGVVIANMVGSVRNTVKALDAGVDMIIAQGTEGGGHTGHLTSRVGWCDWKF